MCGHRRQECRYEAIIKPGLGAMQQREFSQHGENSMTTTRRAILAGGSLLTSAALLRDVHVGVAQPADAGAAPVPNTAPLETAVEAYIYGYPLVTMEMTRRVTTNAEKPQGLRGPMGQFASAREYPTAAFKDVTAPNADTLYSSAWLDLSQEPWILQLPDEHGRYYLMPMLEAWTDVFADPGTRTTGTGAGEFAIVGPDWHGELPAGVEELRSRTNLVWIIGRTYCTGTPEDYAAVHTIQDQYKLVPLSAYGKPYTPPPGRIDPSIDMKASPREQVERMDTISFFRLLTELMKKNPPYEADAPIFARLARIGLVPGQDLDMSKLASVPNIQEVPKLGVERIAAHYHAGGADVNGWTFFRPAGVYGTDYVQRALITRYGLGANIEQDAVYPTTTVDSTGQALNGANKYIMRFPKGQMPPARGFWSLTMYDAQYFFVANPLNRYTLSGRSKLRAEADGTVEFLIQVSNPGPNEANWLPAPNGPFVLMMRLYWPKENPPSLLDGTWKPPAVEKV
jgi:hypothetical protein